MRLREKNLREVGDVWMSYTDGQGVTLHQRSTPTRTFKIWDYRESEVAVGLLWQEFTRSGRYIGSQYADTLQEAKHACKEAER